MEEETWRLSQQASVLQECRTKARSVWDDAGAREVEVRFLSPLEESDCRFRKAVEYQRGALSEAEQKSRLAADTARTLAEFVKQVSGELESAERLLETASDLGRQSREY